MTRCKDSSRCIDNAWLCDHEDDCGDNWDEEDCGGLFQDITRSSSTQDLLWFGAVLDAVVLALTFVILKI